MTDAGIPMGEGLSRSVAQFFFEVGYGACFAEVTVRNDCKPPFDLTDEHVEQAFPRSIEAYEDGADMDRYLAFADTPPPAAAGDREAEARSLLADLLDIFDFLTVAPIVRNHPEIALAPKPQKALDAIRLALRTPEPNSGGEAGHG